MNGESTAVHTAECTSDNTLGDTHGALALGIAITENPDSPTSDGLSWRVDSVPMPTIGEFDNASEAYLFDRIRDALRLAEDTVR